ncbi:MAG: methyltransferase [Desulfobacteraceae bacterium]
MALEIDTQIIRLLDHWPEDNFSSSVIICNPTGVKSAKVLLKKVLAGGAEKITLITTDYLVFQSLRPTDGNTVTINASIVSWEKLLSTSNNQPENSAGELVLKRNDTKPLHNSINKGSNTKLIELFFGIPVFSSKRNIKSGENDIIYFIAKSKPEVRFLSQLLAQVGPKRFFAIGANDAGGKSFASTLKDMPIYLEKIQSKAKHSLWYGTLNGHVNSVNIDSEKLEYDLPCADQVVRVASFPGVFSTAHLDPGSELLIEVLEDIFAERGRPWESIVDIGCGSGVLSISLCIKGMVLKKVSLTDCSYLALASSYFNFNRLFVKKNSIENRKNHNGKSGDFDCVPWRIMPSDSGEGLEIEEAPDLVISNPPFHRGKRQDTEIFARIARNAYDMLCLGGEFIFVANSFLKYYPVVEQIFGNSKTLKRNRSYSVYRSIVQKKKVK